MSGEWYDHGEPFCEHRWMRLPGRTYDLCLLPKGHDGHCRTYSQGSTDAGSWLDLGAPSAGPQEAEP